MLLIQQESFDKKHMTIFTKYVNIGRGFLTLVTSKLSPLAKVIDFGPGLTMLPPTTFHGSASRTGSYGCA